MQSFCDNWPPAFAEGSDKRIKQMHVYNRSDAAYALAKKYKAKLACGTDVLHSTRTAGATTQ